MSCQPKSGLSLLEEKQTGGRQRSGRTWNADDAEMTADQRREEQRRRLAETGQPRSTERDGDMEGDVGEGFGSVSVIS